MPAHIPDNLDTVPDAPRDWTAPEELAIAVLEGLTAPQWQAVAELSQQHTRGGLSYAAWRVAMGALLSAAARATWRQG